jgi:plasmid stability protein
MWVHNFTGSRVSVNLCHTGLHFPGASMSNLTVVVDDAIIKQARVRALQDGTSLSAKVREFLVNYAEGAPKRSPRDATADLMRLMEEVRAEAKPGPLPPDSRPFKRESIYEADFRKNG